MTAPRPSRITRPTEKLGKLNAEPPILNSHRANIASTVSHEQPRPSSSSTPEVPPPPTAAKRPRPRPSVEVTSDDEDDAGSTNSGSTVRIQGLKLKVTSGPSSVKNHLPAPVEVTSDAEDDSEKTDTDSTPRPKKGKGKKKAKHTHPDPSVEDADGMYHDVDVVDIGPEVIKKKNKHPTADIKQFFSPPFRIPSNPRPRRKCNICNKDQKSPIDGITDDCTTLRRHMQVSHKKYYLNWCKTTGFISMLPEDSSAHRAAAHETLLQTQVNEHFPTVKPEDKPVPYTDALWEEAAIQWLADTDQPIQAFEHPSFQRMIHIAATATKGINIPNRQRTRAQCIDMFKVEMHKLKARLNSAIVSGDINLTCDAWQASNTDSYFAVTGHWIEERSPGKWTLEHALFGFTHMNTAHNGKRLGQALYKICLRLAIVHKIGHVTCDNATNNDTMMKEFAKRFQGNTGRGFDIARGHIRCLAHIINLATQALISTRSKSKYFNPHDTEQHMPDVSAVDRDETGLIRAIVVKERSSSQRKELFKTIQKRTSTAIPLQLLLDMQVRWGSTYNMLKRALAKQTDVDTFVYELGCLAGKESLAKRLKIDALRLSREEWARVKSLCSLLKHADKAQQAFSSVSTPTLYNAIPALETLYSAWEGRLGKDVYAPFAPAITAALKKIDEYYQKTASSDAHIMAMILHPERKMRYFKKNWSAEQQREVLEFVETIFKERYLKLHQTPSTSVPVPPPSADSDSENSDSDDEVDPDVDPSRPWLAELNRYLNTHDVIAPGMTMVEWWGQNYHRYFVMGSLSRDYLSIMASSVSSERAFSSAGITLSKRRNRLQKDIVEALQFIKCYRHSELLFREVVTAEAEEKEMDALDLGTDKGGFEEVSWEEAFIDDEDIADSDTEVD